VVGYLARAIARDAKAASASKDSALSLRGEIEDLRELLVSTRSTFQEPPARQPIDEDLLAPPEEGPIEISMREPALGAIEPDTGPFEPAIGEFENGPAGDWLEELRSGMEAIAEIAKRLDRMEDLQRALADRLWNQIAAADRGAGLAPEVPIGTSVRDYLRALKEVDGVAEAHQLWTTQRVLGTYGQPDEIADREDYIEWIYHLPEEGEQFDFHFVNGLCVQAH
jgi:hypothetical protein